MENNPQTAKQFGDYFSPLWFGLGLGPVHEIELLGSTGEGCVEPVDLVGGEHVVGHIALIQIDVRPLSALSFMAGDGIGKFHL